MGYVHEEFFKVKDPKTGNITRGFITGVPDKCKHDFSETAFVLANGDILLEEDYRCPTDEATQEYIRIEAERRNTYVSGGTGVCSKCKKPYNPMQDPAFWEI